MSTKTPAFLAKLSPLAAAIAFALTAPSLAYSKNFVIDTDKDNELDDKTSIREAFAEINEAGPGKSHTITFNSRLSGKTLEIGSLYIYEESKLSIDGSGAEDLTLSLNTDEQVGLGVKYDSELTLKNLSLTLASGVENYAMIWGIGSDVTIDNVNFSNEDNASSSASLMFGDSNVSINSSSFTDLDSKYAVQAINGFKYGGKLKSSLSITNSTFENNNSAGVFVLALAGVGYDEVPLIEEGLYSQSVTDVVIANSSFSNNRGGLGFAAGTSKYNNSKLPKLSVGLEGLTIADNDYGGIVFASYGADAELALVNSTIAGNGDKEGEGGSAVDVSAYDKYTGNDERFALAIAQSTIVGNSTAIDASDTTPAVTIEVDAGADMTVQLEVANSIISNNERIYVDDVSEVRVAVDSDIQLFTNKNKLKLNVRNSLIGVEEFFKKEDDNPYFAVGSRITGSDNLIGVDPMLGELMDNGGSTLTIAPLEGSPVINAGNVALVEKYKLETDQRGGDRIIGDRPDMGAVELCDDDCKNNKSSGLFGSFGIHYITAAFGLAWLRRRKQG